MLAGKGKARDQATSRERDGGERIRRELVRLAEQRPELAEAVLFYQAAIPLLRQSRQAIPPFQIEPEAARKKLQAGLPLLVGEQLPLDRKSTRALFLNLCRIAESTHNPASNGKNRRADIPVVPPAARPDRFFDAFPLWKRAHDGDGPSLRAAAARQIRRAVESGALDLQAVWAMLAGGEGRRLELTAVELKLDLELLHTLAQYSLKPAFQRWAQDLQEWVDQHHPELIGHWQRGVCPVCGSAASLSETQGKEAARRLRCGLCGASWPYPHLQCAFCQNHNYKLLTYLSVEGEEDRYKLQACDVCQGYIKIVKTFEPVPVDLLPVQELSTLHLDWIAAEHGYARDTRR